MPDTLSPVPRPHMVEGDNGLHRLFSGLSMHATARVHSCIYKNEGIKYIDFKHNLEHDSGRDGRAPRIPAGGREMLDNVVLTFIPRYRTSLRTVWPI